jgi:hypothetical protein
LILDELGYVPTSKLGAELLFDVINTASKRTGRIVTTNLPLERRQICPSTSVPRFWTASGSPAQRWIGWHIAATSRKPLAEVTASRTRAAEWRPGSNLLQSEPTAAGARELGRVSLTARPRETTHLLRISILTPRRALGFCTAAHIG